MSHKPMDPSWTLGTMAFQLPADREAYVLTNSSGYSKAAATLAAETIALGEPAVMMLGKEQYAFIKFMARLLGCRLALDLGTFTGLSALALAEALPDGRVITVDRSEEWTSMAERHWRAAGVRDRIEARYVEADQALADLANSGERIDFAFIDVNKASLPRYADAVLALLTASGVMAVDNTFWHGWVLDAQRTDADTEGVRRFNLRVATDESLEAVMLPIADGMTLVRRRDRTVAK
jgi:caffeoyl-CoA O-methyltransferase